MDRQKVLLSIVGVLVLARFVIVPYFEFRNERIDELIRLKGMFAKSARLSSEVELLEQRLPAIEENLKSFENVITQAPDVDFVRLDIQRQIENVARKYDVTLENIEWGEVIAGTPSQIDLEIGFKSKFKNLLMFQHDIQALQQSISTTSIYAAVNKQNIGWKKLGFAQGNFRMRVYFMSNDGTQVNE
ncbi:MAG: hypothetical protein ACFHVJ_20255 [Aestuariibacter sp.]